MSNGSVGLGASLDTKLIKNPHRARSIRIPGYGRMILTKDKGQSNITAQESMQSILTGHHFDGDGKLKGSYDMGSGLVQCNLVQGLAADQLGTSTNKAAPILANSGTKMWSGTGSTVNSYDFQLATTAGPISGAVTTTPSTATVNSVLTYVGTIAYTTTLAITEWGLFNASTTQGSTSVSTVNTSTSTGTSASTWSVAPTGINSWAGYVAVVTGTPVGGFILSNSTATTSSLITINGWYNLTSGGGGGSTPTSNSTINIYPLMSDHKTFAAINVVNGDSIQFTYTLTINSGG